MSAIAVARTVGEVRWVAEAYAGLCRAAKTDAEVCRTEPGCVNESRMMSGRCAGPGDRVCAVLDEAVVVGNDGKSLFVSRLEEYLHPTWCYTSKLPLRPNFVFVGFISGYTITITTAPLTH